ncbi:SAM-dependent methyltransferase [Polycladidibacter hongkongensis]|uniref:SAM-dependent methyltransferase n=1 Tax=Polycladidibacter hongkongensis TaxID=1647556 RepID=UPI000833A70F|nr:cyclopropane-fatty-acyl-phospholipid synthase family protein [Pseudovibrio hongkongensis]
MREQIGHVAPSAPAEKSGRGLVFTLWRALLDRVFGGVQEGSIIVQLPKGQTLHYGRVCADGAGVVVRIKRGRLVRRLASGGGLALAEAYLDGDWECDDLRGLFDVFVGNKQMLHGLITRGSLSKVLARLRHLARANTKRGSRRNIAFHYDLGNAFYRAWLDETMTYSSAYKLQPGGALAAAQRRKYARVLELCALSSGERLLEVGCGWGGLAEEALKCGQRYHGITLSKEQLAFAQKRNSTRMTAGSDVLELQDYRDVNETYDAIASIEMIEAVGEEHWPAYFNVLHDALKPGGNAVIQAITIADDRFHSYRRNVDFIQHYIFPGGMLPCEATLRREAGDAGLELVELEYFGKDYERTLMLWRDRFLQAWPQIAELGFDERFKRMWHYYLVYCAAGFAEGTINVGLFRFQRPE